MNSKLRSVILKMVEVDQAIRTQFVHYLKPGVPTPKKAIDKMERVDTDNTNRLKEIIKEYGWPGKSLVGEDGANGAWLIAQHADRNVAFQEEALSLLKKAVTTGEATKRQLAYLTDRTLLNQGKNQIYGTQVSVNNGKVEPKDLEDPDNLDTIRAKMGLEPFCEYAKLFIE